MLVEEQEAEMMRNEEGHIPPSPLPLFLYSNKPYYIICHHRDESNEISSNVSHFAF